MSWNLVGVVVAQCCECTKCHGTVHFNIFDFILCEFHPIKQTITLITAQDKGDGAWQVPSCLRPHFLEDNY